MIKFMETCPICSSHDSIDFLQTNDFAISGESFLLKQCRDCRFIWTANAPTIELSSKYYESEDYVSHSDTSKGFINKLYHSGRNYMLKQKFRLINRYNSTGRILDIGCGTGYFINYLANRGYDTKGIEISEDARSFAKSNFDLEVYHPDWFLNDSGKATYDIITLWHVLEHLHDFNKYLERIYESLESSGSLFIAVPNHTSFDAKKYKEYWAGYDVPRHLWHFSPNDIKSLMAKYNFEIISMKMMPLDPFYNAMLSEKYKKNKGSMISAGWFGLTAFLKGKLNVERASSIIYIMKKKK